MDSIIFDVDGTLWDCTPVVARAWTRAAHSLTGKDYPISADDLRSLFGRLLPDIAKNLFPDLSEDRQKEVITCCCEEQERSLRREKPVAYPGFETVLPCLAEKYPLFIVSNCQAGYIETFLDVTGYGPYFTDHLCPGDTQLAKAENILEIVHRHALKAPVYVGDTSGDQVACRKAGIPFVYASYGFRSAENPDYTIDKPEDLMILF